MEKWFCTNCKQWIEVSSHMCSFKFCPCTPDKMCDFHKRGGYVTHKDEILKSPKEIKATLQQPVPRFHKDPKHCEICAEQHMRLERYRCEKHWEN